ncbi:MAG: hydroxyacid dehydrogenase [Acidisphaera sp.]|nr:hydroxyacid dehydrogenase [Acidisphaera sp.]
MPGIFLTHSPDMLANYYGDRALAALREQGDVRLNRTGRVLDDPLLLAREVGDAAIVVADRQTPGPAAFFDAAPDVVAFCRVAVDIRNIDVEAASRHGVLVTRATPGFIASVSELAVGFMVDLARGISTAVGRYRGGEPVRVQPGRQLQGASLGIVGYGAIGERLAELGLALGMTVLVHDPYRQIAPPLRQAEFSELLGAADFVVCLAVATESTENLFGEAAFAAMRRGAYFINLSRGNLVDEAALERALEERRIAGAAMDVGRAQDQMPSPQLARRADVVATPHIGGLTPQAAEHQAFDSVHQVAALVRGEVPPGAVNAEAAHRLSRLRP